MLEPLGIRIAFTPIGITLALMFIGIPFVVRTVQPVLQDLDAEVEEAAATLGASRFRTFRKLCCPSCCRRCSPGLRWHFPAASGSTAPSCSFPATCR
ncbi:hypothetical protein HMSSN036_83280 [Paenibacillus macerans]|nr:hypothetical protein HMSSN036_83280 [Paenibacillus macerans]